MMISLKTFFFFQKLNGVLDVIQVGWALKDHLGTTCINIGGRFYLKGSWNDEFGLGYDLDIQCLDYLAISTSLCLSETCVCYNIGMVYVILYHSHLFKNINMIIHAQYVGESNDVKIFIWSLFEVSVHVVNLNYVDINY